MARTQVLENIEVNSIMLEGIVKVLAEQNSVCSPWNPIEKKGATVITA